MFRFTDTYPKMYGGRMWIAMDPPTADSTPQEGLLNVSDFSVRDERLQQMTQNQGNGPQSGVSFSRMRAEFTRATGALSIREGIVAGPTMGATIEGQINYGANQVRMSGTFLPAYGLNNIFGQIPIVGLFLGGGSNEGLIGITYEVVGIAGLADAARQSALRRGARRAAQDLRLRHRPPAADPARQLFHDPAELTATAAQPVARMSAATSGTRSQFSPAYRCAHAGYGLHHPQQHVPLAAHRQLDHAFAGQVRRRQHHLLVRHRLVVDTQAAGLDLAPRFAV